MRAALLIALCCACGARGGGDATFRVFYPDPQFRDGSRGVPGDGFKAKVGKKFFLEAVGQCTYTNGREGKWSMTGARLASGKLPPGLSLEEGKISGRPIEAGTWAVAIEFDGVVCAGAKRPAQTIEVTIVAK